MPGLLRRLLLLFLLPTSAICRGAGIALGDVALEGFAFVCFAAGVAVLVVGNRDRIERWMGAES